MFLAELCSICQPTKPYLNSISLFQQLSNIYFWDQGIILSILENATCILVFLSKNQHLTSLSIRYIKYCGRGGNGEGVCYEMLRGKIFIVCSKTWVLR